MPNDKYISFNTKTNGYTFANIGFFYGLGGAIFSTIYSLILFEIFGDASIVGLYSAAFAVFAMFSSEIFRLLPKTKILPLALLTIIITTFGMVFQPSAGSFIALDIFREFGWALLIMSLTLFMSEFAGAPGISKVSGRYYTLNNLGSIIAPVVALRFATMADDIRAPLVLVSVVMLLALFYYRNYKITAADKRALPKPPFETLRKVFGNLREFAGRPELARAYAASFGYYAVQALRGLYVPLAVVGAGFSKDTLGLVLAIGTIPFAILAAPSNALAKRLGAGRVLAAGFVAYSALALFASFSTGMLMLALFVAWQIPNSVIEPIKELPFHSGTSKSEKSKFMGVFQTSKYLAKVLSPLAGAGIIFVCGTLSSVWFLAAALGLASAYLARGIKKQ
jgi:MFS family permease